MLRGRGLSELLARIEHAGLHGRLRDGQNLGGLGDGLLVIVDEVDHLGVVRREPQKSLAQGFAVALLLKGDVRRVG